MMAKRGSLFALPDAPAALEEEKPAPKRKVAKAPRPPSREGKRILSVYLDPAAWKQLRHLSVDQERSTQALGEEAITLLFRKYAKGRVA